MLRNRTALVLALAAGACSSDSSPGPDGARPGDGGATGADAQPPDAPVDAPREAAGPAAPVEGGPGCAPGSLCRNLTIAYAEAVLRAQSCTPGAANVCNQSAPGSLGCGGCTVWITSSAEVDSLRAQFQGGGCAACFFGSPTGDRCHPVICPDLLRGTCTAAAGGRGTCTIEKQPEQCPQGTANGLPCPLAGWYCTTVTAPKRSCICRPAMNGQMAWLC
jgi:hypothetical protein